MSVYIQHACFLLLVTGIGHVSSAIAKDYCHWQPFSLRCPAGQVILMETALYGRMRLGECIKTNERIGCSLDVLRAMDSLCSGRQNCTGISNRIFYQNLKCGEMIAYLEASYECLGGNTSLFMPTLNELARCGGDHPIPVTSPKEGYILGGTDTKGCPIRIHALPGQTIRIYLYDFGKTVHQRDMSYKGGGGGEITYRFPNSQTYLQGNHVTATIAERYASLRDRAAVQQSITVTSTEERHSLVYTSEASILDVELAPNTLHKFILRYQAVGCPDPVLPPDMYILRKGQKASVYCNFSSNAWHIVCKGTQWVGPITNCTTDLKHAQTPWTDKEVGHTWESFGLVIAVFIGVLIGGICGFAMLVLVMIYRKRKKRMHRQCSASAGINGKECPNYGLFTSNHCSTQSLGSGTNYTHIWRLQQQRPNNSLADQYPQSSERMLTGVGPISEVEQAEQDYDGSDCTLPPPAVTYICRHNKNYEKPVPQIISDSQKQHPCSQTANRSRLWSPLQGPRIGQNGDQLTPDINDSGIET